MLRHAVRGGCGRSSTTIAPVSVSTRDRSPMGCLESGDGVGPTRWVVRVVLPARIDCLDDVLGVSAVVRFDCGRNAGGGVYKDRWWVGKDTEVGTFGD